MQILFHGVIGMIQQTSLVSWNEINLAGVVGKQQAIIFTAIKQLNEATNKEIAAYTKLEINSVTPRVYELRAKGLVTRCNKRSCNISGRTANSWKIKRV
jgi:DNA-binding MarR family transcriptional regulator